jgi:hypothetical protein
MAKVHLQSSRGVQSQIAMRYYRVHLLWVTSAAAFPKLGFRPTNTLLIVSLWFC